MRIAIFAASLIALSASAAIPASAQDAGKSLTWSVGDPVGNLDIDASLEGTSRRLLKGNVGEGLTKVTTTEDGKLGWEPLLATSWEQVDETRWRFKLRHGVTFSDGKPMTAEDVVFSVNKIADPKSAKTSILNNIAGAEKVDDQTVDVLTKSPDFFVYRAVAEIVIEPDGWGVEDPQKAQTTLIGTGPYALESLSAGRDLATLVRNDTYWGPKPFFDTVKLRVIPDSGARLAALNAGEIDVAFDLAPDLAQAAPASLSASATEVDILRINAASAPLDDVRVRQALNYAVDQKVLIDNVRLGFAALPNGQAVTTPVHGYNPNLKDYGYDVDKAKSLIEQAGAEGAELNLMCPSEYYGQVGIDTCQTLQANYQAIGLKVNLQFLPHDRWIKEGLLAPQNKLTPPDLFYIQAGSETLDATPYIRNYLTCNTDRSTICDKELADKANAALALPDQAEQDKAYQDVLALAHDKAVMVWLTNPSNVVAVAKDIAGPIYNVATTVYWSDWSRPAQ